MSQPVRVSPQKATDTARPHTKTDGNFKYHLPVKTKQLLLVQTVFGFCLAVQPKHAQANVGATSGQAVMAQAAWLQVAAAVTAPEY